MQKRKPILTIAITANNHAEKLVKCLDSLLNLKKAEIIVINNYSEDENKISKIQKICDSYKKKINLFFYQSVHLINKNKARNMALDFSNGFWIYFIDDFDYFSERFISFLNSFKFNITNHFYRIPIYSSNVKIKAKKESITLFKSKYYSTNISSFILNAEWLRETDQKWDDYLIVSDNVPFMLYLYNYPNVNFEYLKLSRTIYHNFNYERNIVNFDTEQAYLFDTFNRLLEIKKHNQKQFLVLIIYNFYKLSSSTKRKQLVSSYKKPLRKARVFVWNYIFLGFKLWFKTMILRWRMFI